MTGSIALDVVIGLVFIYSLYSLLATTVTELLASAIRLRSAFLIKGIKRMLDDGSKTEIFSGAFFEQPLVKYLASKDGVKPSYMAARNFSKNLLEVLKAKGLKALPEGTSNSTDIEKVRAILDGSSQLLGQSETIQFIRSLLDDAQNDMEKFKLYLEQWYDDTMERVSTWYKRRLQIITFVMGFFIAAIFNVDTIKIVRKLSVDPVIRNQLVTMAQQYVTDAETEGKDDPQEKPTSPCDSIQRMDTVKLENFIKLRDQALEANSVLSIEREEDDWCGFMYISWESFLGWLITALALSLGSPFWFDILNKLIKLRTGGRPSEGEVRGGSNSSQALTADKREG
jgi:hypothetical protein